VGEAPRREAGSRFRKITPPGGRGFFPTGLFPHGAFSPRGFFPTGFFPHGAFPHGAFSPRGFSPRGFSPRGFFPTGFFPHGVFSPRGFFPTGLFPTGLFPTGLFPTGLFPHGAFPPRGFSPTVVSWHAACMATPLGIPGGEIAPDARGSPENRANHSRYDRTRSVPIGRYRRFYGLVFWGVSPLKIALARGLLVVQIPCQRRGFFLHFFSL
jgi:hypothetical protein